VINGVTPFDGEIEFDAFIRVMQSRLGKTLICGGDTVAAFRQKLTGAIFSTGGGSTLHYLADMNLPALQIINHG
jgi:3-phosphoglycerate kinase